MLSEIVAEIQFVTGKKGGGGGGGGKFSELIFFSLQTTTGSFGGDTSGTRRSVEHCTPHADGAWLNELGWSQ